MVLNGGQFCDYTVFETSVSHVSHGEFALQKVKKACLGEPLLDRGEREKKDKVL